MKRLRVAAGLCLLAPALAAAQQLYKCGNTFSQTPCAPDATAKTVRPSAPPEPAPGLRGYDLCAAAALRSIGAEDPRAAEVQPAAPRTMEVIRYAGQPISAHRYDLSIEIKSPTGLRPAPIPASCWVSEDQARILQFARR